MDNFMKETFDLKRFILLSWKRVWFIGFWALICSLFFGMVYFAQKVVFAGPQEYVGKQLYEITFVQEQVGDIHDYYNDFTWNDVLDSDRIAGEASKRIGISKEEIANSTKIPTMSDIRFIWVEVTSTSAPRAERIQKGIQQALIEFAQQTPGFREITVCDSIPVKEKNEKIYLLRWFVFGAVVGAVFGALYLFYENAMDDSMYIEEDVKKHFGLLCAGVWFHGTKSGTREAEELKANLSCILESVGEKPEVHIAFAEAYERSLDGEVKEEDIQKLLDQAAQELGKGRAVAHLQHCIPGKERAYYMGLREADYIIWLLPFGKRDGARLDRAWKNLHFWNCIPQSVILTNVNKLYYRAYYSSSRKLPKQKEGKKS